tara:strand:+ start:2416 stop:3003 length:588 start_codon:yes stop_codon:yes gene_type:complete
MSKKGPFDDLAGHMLGTSKQAKLAKKYGIEGVRFSHPDGRSGKPTRLPGQVGDEIAAAMNKDYDVRDTVKYAADSGNKKAQNIGAIDNIDAAFKASNLMRKTHNKKMGNGGGDYKGNTEDDAGVADYWFNQSRDKFGAGFATQGDLNDMSVESQQAAAQTKEPYKESEGLTQAKERVQAWQTSNSGSTNSPYGQR